MVSLNLPVASYRRILTLIGAVCLAYICSYVSLIMSASYPDLRFFGRYFFILAVLCIFLLTADSKYRITQFPSYFFLLVFTIYYLLHCIIFENGGLESYGLSIYIIFFLGVGFWNLIKTKTDYLQILLVTWITLLLAIVYYTKFVIDFGPILSRITPEDMGLEINGNVLCFMSAILSILSVRIYEIYSSGNASRSAYRQRIETIALSFINLACLMFTIWHLNMTFTFINLITLGLITYRYSDKFMKLGLLIMVAIAFNYSDFTRFDSDLLGQIELYSDRLESGGSSNQRLQQATYVYNQWMINPIFGESKNYTVLDGSGSSNHTFYLNILAIYGVMGFLLFALLILSLILPGITSMSVSQMLARLIFLIMWMVGPSTYPQAIALLIIFPDRYYLTNN